MTVSTLYKSRKEMAGRTEALNLKSLSCRESLGNYPSLYSLNTSSGASFLKLSVITGPVELFCFPFQMGVSKDLKIVQ